MRKARPTGVRLLQLPDEPRKGKPGATNESQGAPGPWRCYHAVKGKQDEPPEIAVMRNPFT